MPRNRRKPMAEINVVPYIDVMMVLLVIFMISTPLLTQGVKVSLPESDDTESLDIKPSQTIIVKVDVAGKLYLTIGMGNEKAVVREQLIEQIMNKQQKEANVSVLISGDKEVRYVFIMDVLALLSQAGIVDVGLMTKALDDKLTE
ncbi:MAG: ExbD/TolR family protein [Gammaproteobacteria bacterium]|nr:ExbD/TolR family protein [Gammaproteobacteria bacterium]